MTKHPLPGLGAPLENSADHGPVEPGLGDLMVKVAHVLDDIFNGEDCKAEDKKIGFFLTAFKLNEHQGRFNYVSNSDPLDVLAMLKDITARIEGRMQAAGRA